MKNIIRNISLISMCVLMFVACSKDSDMENYGQDMSPSGLKSELRITSYPPFIIGQMLEFSFAAGSPDQGALKTIEVEASIAGAAGTTLDTKGRFFNWATNRDETYTLFTSINTTDKLSSGTCIDTVAATARYYYVIPQEAKGQKLNFKFTVKTSNNKQSTQIYNCTISNMFLEKGFLMDPANPNGLTKSFFSISKSKVYTRAEVESEKLYSEIDFVFVIDKDGPGQAWKLNRAILSPANQYMPAGVLGSVWNQKNQTQIEIKDWEDFQIQNNVKLNAVDDIDLINAKFVTSTQMMIGISANSRALVKSSDGKWIAYINVANASDTQITVNMKKYNLK